MPRHRQPPSGPFLQNNLIDERVIDNAASIGPIAATTLTTILACTVAPVAGQVLPGIVVMVFAQYNSDGADVLHEIVATGGSLAGPQTLASLDMTPGDLVIDRSVAIGGDIFNALLIGATPVTITYRVTPTVASEGTGAATFNAQETYMRVGLYERVPAAIVA